MPEILKLLKIPKIDYADLKNLFKYSFLLIHETLLKLLYFWQSKNSCLNLYNIKVPITTNNNVCFVTASDRFRRESLYERQIAPAYNRMAHEITHLGPYSAAQMEYMNLKCRIQHTSHVRTFHILILGFFHSSSHFSSLSFI